MSDKYYCRRCDLIVDKSVCPNCESLKNPGITVKVDGDNPADPSKLENQRAYQIYKNTKSPLVPLYTPEELEVATKQAATRDAEFDLGVELVGTEKKKDKKPTRIPRKSR